MGYSNTLTAEFGFRNQHSKVSIEPKSTLEFLRNSSEFSRYDIESPKEENSENSETLQGGSESNINLSHNTNWQTSLHSGSNSSRTTATNSFPTQPTSGNVIKEFFEGESDPLRPRKKGNKLVDLKFKSIEWEIFDNSSRPDDYTLRCLEQNLGRIKPG